MNKTAKTRIWLIVTIVVLAVVIFVLDLLLPLGVAGGVPYVVLVLLSLWFPDRRYTFIAAIAGTVLTVFGYVYSPPGGGGLPWIVLVNRLLALFAIWVTTILSLQRKRAEDRLGEAEERLRKFIDSASSGFGIFDSRLNFIDIDKGFPMTRDEVIGRNVADIAPGIKETGRYDQYMEVIRTGNPITLAEVTPHPKFGEVVLSIQAFPVGDGLGVITTDVTKRKRAEDALRESEERYRNLVETSQGLIWQCDSEGRFTYLNPTWESTIGYKVDEMIGRRFTEFKPPEIAKRDTKTFEETLKGLNIFGYETIYISKSGEQRNLIFTARMLKDAAGNIIGTQGTAYDITERKQAEKQIKASLQEKEILLKEIHHRVKNNLQVVSSLLDLQAGYIEDEQTRQMFKESQYRIKSMALVHERLYQTKDLSKIDFAQYVESLTNYLSRSYGARNISLRSDIAPVSLSVETAIPCGLIINELVSNAMKHAFPPEAGRAGEIGIELQTDRDRQLALWIRDNGVGFPPGVDFRCTKSLGLTLVMTLVKQMEGTIELQGEGGTEFKIVFTAPA